MHFRLKLEKSIKYMEHGTQIVEKHVYIIPKKLYSNCCLMLNWISFRRNEKNNEAKNGENWIGDWNKQKTKIYPNKIIWNLLYSSNERHWRISKIQMQPKKKSGLFLSFSLSYLCLVICDVFAICTNNKKKWIHQVG